MKKYAIVFVILTLSLLLAACGSDGAQTSLTSATAAPAATEAPAPTEEPAPAPTEEPAAADETPVLFTAFLPQALREVAKGTLALEKRPHFIRPQGPIPAGNGDMADQVRFRHQAGQPSSAFLHAVLLSFPRPK